MEEAKAQERTGKDEMNFAEFPLGFLSERVPKGIESFVVERTVKHRGKSVQQRLRVVPSRDYGFPVAKDREIVTACIQATKRAGFPDDGKVFFSRYELIDSLQWEHGGEQYRRLTYGLNKLKFTGYQWDQSWWDHDAKDWCDHSFSLLDNVVIPRSDIPQNGDAAAHPRRCWFKWNEVVLASFRAGFIKDLNMDIYRSLSSLTAKEMYRFLDKNFYWRQRIVDDVFSFAFNTLGMRGRSYERNVSKIKESLREPIEELASHGILKPMSDADRFVKKNGQWQVILEKGNGRRVARRPTPAKSVLNEKAKKRRDMVLRSLKKRDISHDAAVLFELKHTDDELKRAVRAMDEQRERGQTIQKPDRWFAAALQRNFDASKTTVATKRPELRIFRADNAA